MSGSSRSDHELSQIVTACCGIKFKARRHGLCNVESCCESKDRRHACELYGPDAHPVEIQSLLWLPRGMSQRDSGLTKRAQNALMNRDLT
jgi:hypothetical protein